MGIASDINPSHILITISDSLCLTILYPLLHNVPSALDSEKIYRSIYMEWDIQLCILIACIFLHCVLSVEIRCCIDEELRLYLFCDIRTEINVRDYAELVN